jgi:hypothetical protein
VSAGWRLGVSLVNVAIGLVNVVVDDEQLAPFSNSDPAGRYTS